MSTLMIGIQSRTRTRARVRKSSPGVWREAFGVVRSLAHYGMRHDPRGTRAYRELLRTRLGWVACCITYIGLCLTTTALIVQGNDLIRDAREASTMTQEGR